MAYTSRRGYEKINTWGRKLLYLGAGSLRSLARPSASHLFLITGLLGARTSLVGSQASVHRVQKTCVLGQVHFLL